MSIDITIKIGGEAGQGILTVGELITTVCHNAGFYILSNNEFESRIRGGHSFTQIRISDTPVNAPNYHVHLLVSLDQQTHDLHKKELTNDALTIIEGKGELKGNDVLYIPFSELAQEAGGRITSNSVAAGACLALLGAPFDAYRAVLAERFASKGESAIENNIKAGMLGYEAVSGTDFTYEIDWKVEKPPGMIIEGAKAIALGALAGDCRIAAFYPMSPATGIMAYLADWANSFPLVVEQAEDEIAAVNMAIGASFAGIRSMTATSGGGFCLMTEGLGLAGITETPIVIVNAQRPGPATGLPTRTAQGDLLFMLHAAQDEFPRFVFAPGSPAEAFEYMSRAFYLTEKYQVPVIVLTDKYLNDTLFTETAPLPIPESIERFFVEDGDIEDVSEYKRYELTSSGISPRALPCLGKSLVVASGNEHTEDGHISENKLNRTYMVNKRNAKIAQMMTEIKPPQRIYQDADIFLVGWGSVAGVITEAVEKLRCDGIDAGAIIFTDLWPFPAEAFLTCIDKGQSFFMVELNSSSQLGQLIRGQTGMNADGSVLKYDGRPFYSTEIVDGIKQYMR